jgi:peptidoglycan/LPS O-acetylase OafA/YrhL
MRQTVAHADWHKLDAGSTPGFAAPQTFAAGRQRLANHPARSRDGQRGIRRQIRRPCIPPAGIRPIEDDELPAPMTVSPSARASVPASGSDRRIVALDGIRGLMTLMVVVSHFFAELPGGLGFLAFGWVAVDMFFVLSGLLVGRLIIDKGDRSNFLAVFYVRRACRTFPIYFFCVLAALAIFSLMPAAWSAYHETFPLWSYATFSQNILMVVSGGVGAHWLAPTWTLVVEEQFYLFAPAVMLFTPRRWLLPVLVAVAVSAILFRTWVALTGHDPLMSLVLFPGRADTLVCGLVAAVLLARSSIRWERLDLPLRIAPIVLLLSVVVLKLAEGEGGRMQTILAHAIVSIACAAFLIAVVRDAPEAARLKSRVLCFFGTTSYAVYLTHLPILWLMHGLVLGTQPALGSATQWGVTILSLPLCAGVGWVLTRLVEEPITSYGRSWKWSAESARASRPAPASTIAPSATGAN